MGVQRCWREASGIQRPIARNVATGQVAKLTFAVIGSHIHGLGLQGCLHTGMSMNIAVYVACATDIVAKTV